MHWCAKSLQKPQEMQGWHISDITRELQLWMSVTWVSISWCQSLCLVLQCKTSISHKLAQPVNRGSLLKIVTTALLHSYRRVFDGKRNKVGLCSLSHAKSSVGGCVFLCFCFKSGFSLCRLWVTMVRELCSKNLIHGLTSAESTLLDSLGLWIKALVR